MEKFLTPKQVSEYLQVRLSTVYLWTSTEFIPHFKIGKCVRFRETDLCAWVDHRYNKGRFSMKLRVPNLSGGNESRL